MKGLSIALRILAVIGAVAAVAAWAMTNGKLEEADQATKRQEQRAAAVEGQISDLEGEVATLRSNSTQLNSDLADSKARVTYLQGVVSESKRETSKLEDSRSDLQAEFKELDGNYQQLKRELIDLQTTRQATTAVASSDPAKVQEYEDKLAALQEELTKTKDQLTAANLRASASTTSTGGTFASTSMGAASTTDGPAPTIADLNRKSASILRTDFNTGILVISRGQVDGLERQMEFNVTKGLSKKVRVKVGTVAPTYSVAYILPGEDPSHLQEGDEVSLTQ